ncbi:2OG-Fe(II) oxygenase family protein [bacterium]|nr:2OG-Fe(II) oxygenase family protein [bacterium]
MEFIHLGQRVCKDIISGDLVYRLNKKIDDTIARNEQIDYSNQLSAKIKTEYDVVDILKEVDNTQQIPGLLDKAHSSFSHDNSFNWSVKFYAAWGNDQKEGEYQIVHKHSGASPLGYSLILFLKVPNFGPEYQNNEWPTNGRTVIFGNCGGQLSTTHIMIEPKVGDIYIFPYDMEHIVYPFRGDGMRRSISCNFDLIGSK